MLRVLACSIVVMAVALGVRQCLGLFLVPMTAAEVIGRQGFSLGIALQNLAWGASGPFAGWLADRYGARPVVSVCAVLLAAGIGLMALAPSSESSVFVAGLLSGVGLTGTTFTVLFGAIARAHAPADRARAIAWASALGSLGQVVLVPLAQWAIQAWGWRPALWGLCALALVALPAALCLKRESGAPAGALTLAGASLSSACRDRAYVLVAIGFAACGVQLIFIGTHLPAYLVECGLSAADGAWALALVGLFNVIGTVALGRLASRHDPLALLAGVYALRTAAIVIFVSLPPSSLSAAVFAAAMGLLWLGVGPVMTQFLGARFGVAHLSALFGLMYFSHQIGSFFGAWAGAALHDLTASYRAAWWGCVLIGLMAVALTLAARTPSPGQGLRLRAA